MLNGPVKAEIEENFRDSSSESNTKEIELRTAVGICLAKTSDFTSAREIFQIASDLAIQLMVSDNPFTNNIRVNIENLTYEPLKLQI